MLPSRFTKVKIASGYTLLLAVLLLSLLFVRREMETLVASDNQQSLQADSVLLLLREKDQNTIRMLRVLNQSKEQMVSTRDIEAVIAQQDSIVVRKRVQHRVITKRDSLLTKPVKKGFFKRFAEVFSPTKTDTAVLINTSLEFATDTLLEPYYVADTLHRQFRAVAQQKHTQEQEQTTRRRKVQYQRRDRALTARIDSLVKGYEQDLLLHTHQEAEKGKEIRQRSTRILGGIAIGAVLLSAFFLILILRDITRSNRYRREIEEANQRAQALLEAREKLMLAITHDFKAPLGSILGYIDLLTPLTSDDRQRFYLDNMKGSSAHLLKLVNDLLDFHRLDLHKAEINRVTFQPAHLFDEIEVSFRPLTDAKGLTLHAEIDPALNGRFISDPLRLRQVVTNLLSNAVKFTSDGTVTLRATVEPSHLRIDVADTGQGMPPEDRQRIFEEFTRLPGAQGEEGFGLGLSIVHKLVVLLEGEIDVQSKPGEGSCFTVRLPLFPVGESVWDDPTRMETSPCGKHSLSGEHSLSQKPLHVLLIDDDRIQLTLTAAMLAQQDITTVCCQQPDELIEQLRTASFDLLLTDVQMPAINGFDLLRLLRASQIDQARRLPIIAVTARTDMQPGEFLAHGFAGCLHKPFTVAELLAVVDSISSISSIAPVPFECRPPEASAEGGKEETASTIDLSALTAFAEEDAEEARAILQTFIDETRKDALRMQQALKADEVDEVSAVAHKLLPLLTLMGARRGMALLSGLEAHRGQLPTPAWREEGSRAWAAIEEVIEAAVEKREGKVK